MNRRVLYALATGAVVVLVVVIGLGLIVTKKEERIEKKAVRDAAAIGKAAREEQQIRMKAQREIDALRREREELEDKAAAAKAARDAFEKGQAK